MRKQKARGPSGTEEKRKAETDSDTLGDQGSKQALPVLSAQLSKQPRQAKGEDDEEEEEEEEEEEAAKPPQEQHQQQQHAW